jgi:V-type H+-transporting ATPase subunit a
MLVLYLMPVSDAELLFQVAENKIIFMNAFKMKISIIIGVFHMLFGVCLSLWNYM